MAMPRPQYRIGLLYARGEGVVRSMPDAVAWYKRAAEAGHAEAHISSVSSICKER